MDEIKRIADDITIMRDGTYVGTWPAAEMTTDQIITKMVGRELTNVYPPRENKPGDEVVMEVKNLCSIHAKYASSGFASSSLYAAASISSMIACFAARIAWRFFSAAEERSRSS